MKQHGCHKLLFYVICYCHKLLKHHGCYYFFARIGIPEVAFAPLKRSMPWRAFKLFKLLLFIFVVEDVAKWQKWTLAPWGIEGCCVSIPEMAFTLTWAGLLQTATLYIGRWRSRKMRKGLLGHEEIGGCCVSIPEVTVTLTWTVNTLESFQFKGDATHLFNWDAIKDGPGIHVS